MILRREQRNAREARTVRGGGQDALDIQKPNRWTRKGAPWVGRTPASRDGNG